MTTIHFPDSLEIIGAAAFKGSSFNHKGYFMPEGPPLRSIEFGPNSRLQEFHGISGCHYLSKVHLPDSVTCLGSEAFMSCNEGFYGDNQEEFFVYLSQDSHLCDVDMPPNRDRALQLVVTGKIWDKNGDLWPSIESGMSTEVTWICLASILKIPDFVSQIPSNAFVRCSELETVIFGVESRIEVIHGFHDCPKLKEIVISGSIREITGFLDCPQIRVVKFLKGSHLLWISGFHRSSWGKKMNCQHIFFDYCDLVSKRKSLQIALYAAAHKSRCLK
jgi:hypothetical protein